MMSTLPHFNPASRFQYFTSNGDCDYDGVMIPNEQKAKRIDAILQNRVGVLLNAEGQYDNIYQDAQNPITSDGHAIFYKGSSRVRYERCLLGLLQLDNLPEKSKDTDCPCFCTKCFNDKERYSMAVNNKTSMQGLNDCPCGCNGDCKCSKEVLSDNDLSGLDTGSLVAVVVGAALGIGASYVVHGNMSNAVPYAVGGGFLGALIA